MSASWNLCICKSFWECSSLHWMSHQNVPTMDLSEEELSTFWSFLQRISKVPHHIFLSRQSVDFPSEKSLSLVFTYNFLVSFSSCIIYKYLIFIHFPPSLTPTLTCSKEIGLWIRNHQISFETFSRPFTLRNQYHQPWNLKFPRCPLQNLHKAYSV